MIVWNKNSNLLIIFVSLCIILVPLHINHHLIHCKHKLQIPNNITKKKFIAEMFKMYNWEEKDLLPVQNCLQILDSTNNIEPLCQFVEQALVKLNNVNQ